MVNEPHALDREELLEDTAPDQAVVQPYLDDVDDDDAVTLQMDAPLDDGEWMVEVSQGEQRRTLSTEQLVTELASGALGPQARVWRNGMRGWTAAAAQLELTPEAARTTSPTIPAIPASVRAAVADPTPALEPSAVAPPVASMAAAAAAPATPALVTSAPLPSAAPASTPLASAPLGALRPAPLPPVQLPPVPVPPASAPQRRAPVVPAPPSRPGAALSSFSGGSIGSLPLSPPPPRIVPRSSEPRNVDARSVEPHGYAASEPLPAFDEPLRSGRPDTATSVALDLQQVAPRRPSAMRGVMAQGAAAAFALLLTSYGLTRAGVFEPGTASVASEPVAHGTAEGKQPVTTQVLALQAPAELPAVAPAPAEPSTTAAAAEPSTTAPATESAAAVAAAEPAAPAAVAETAAVAAPAEAATVSQPSTPVSASTAVVADAAQKTSAASPGEAPAASAEDPSSAERRAKQAERRAAAAERRAAVAEERRQRRATSVSARAVETPARATEVSAPEPGGNFNREAATAALENAATQAKNCRPMGGPSGAGTVQVQYEPSGKVVSASIVTAGFENSDAADCIEMLFRRAKVPAFNGTKPVTVKQRFEIP